jgi:hypothetical protein
MQAWWGDRPSAFGLGCAPSPNVHGSSKLPDISLLDWLCAKPVWAWVWLPSRPVNLGLNCIPSPIGNEFGSLPYRLTLGLVVCQERKAKGLEIIIVSMFGHKALFVYAYNFSHEMLMLWIFISVHF